MAEPIGSQLPHTGPNTRWANTKRRPAVGNTRLKLMTVSEVATELRRSRGSVYTLIHAGELEAIPVGRRGYRISEAELVRYLREGPRTEPSDRFIRRT